MKSNGIKVLIACEESQAVCVEFRKLGFEAYSCDLLQCSGGHPEWHIKQDVLLVIKGGVFTCESGDIVNIEKWNAMVAHPTCTFLTNSGVCWLYNKDGSKNIDRWDNLEDGALFFSKLLNADIEFIGVENPIPHKYAIELMGRKYDQLIQPYQFGHPESKATCLWLKGFPKLMETENVKEKWKSLPKNEAQRLHYLPPGPERAKLRSKTFKGIAEAIAIQWGNFLLSKHKA